MVVYFKFVTDLESGLFSTYSKRIYQIAFCHCDVLSVPTHFPLWTHLRKHSTQSGEAEDHENIDW